MEESEESGRNTAIGNGGICWCGKFCSHDWGYSHDVAVGSRTAVPVCSGTSSATFYGCSQAPHPKNPPMTSGIQQVSLKEVADHLTSDIIWLVQSIPHYSNVLVSTELALRRPHFLQELPGLTTCGSSPILRSGVKQKEHISHVHSKPFQQISEALLHHRHSQRPQGCPLAVQMSATDVVKSSRLADP